MTARRLRSLVFVLLVLGGLAGAGFGASGGPASTTADIATLQTKLAQCRGDLAQARKAAGDAAQLLALAREGKIVIWSFESLGEVRAVPLSVDQLRDYLIANLVAGKLTKARLASLIRGISQARAVTIRALTELEREDRGARDALATRCARLAKELAVAQKGGQTAPPAAGAFTLVDTKVDYAGWGPPAVRLDPAGSAQLQSAQAAGPITWAWTWKLPQTIALGRKFSVSADVSVDLGGNRSAGLQFTVGLGVNTPIGGERLILDVAKAQSAARTWTFTVPKTGDFANLKELVLSIHVWEGTSVSYRYRLQ